MRYVDHDPAAARLAAAACRDRADDYDRIAGRVGETAAAVAWWGCERDQVVEEAWRVCDDLRREAGSLRSTADLLEAAASAAERRDEELARRAREEAAAAAARAAANACTPTTTVSSSSATSSSASTSGGTSSSGSAGGGNLPRGLQ